MNHSSMFLNALAKAQVFNDYYTSTINEYGFMLHRFWHADCESDPATARVPVEHVGAMIPDPNFMPQLCKPLPYMAV